MTNIDTSYSSASIIFIDDDADFLIAQTQALQLAGYQVQAFNNGADALAHITPKFEGIIISDVRMPHMNGLELFKRVHALDAEIPVILLTGHGDIPMAVQALKEGVYDFISKPFAMEALLASVKRAQQKRQLILENRQLRELHANVHPAKSLLLGNSAAIIHLRQTLERIASIGVDTLILGETGVGKTLVARTLHKLSSRKHRPFVHVSCAGLCEETFPAELFGVEGGVKFGPYASKARAIGHIERAHRGTLFLADVDSLPLAQQAKLLHNIETGALWSLGAEAPREMDVRVIAASKVDLAAKVKAGEFRADLFYRLSGVTLSIPPLRERREDVPLLFNHFLLSACSRLQLPVPKLNLAASSYLKQHDWQGNVRELEQYAEYYALSIEDGCAAHNRDGSAPIGLAECVNRYEADLIRETLQQVQGSAKKAMELLQLPRKTFYDKINRYAIHLDEFRLKKN